MKFYINRHFIYITAWAYEHKEKLQSYYKLTEEDLEEITKDLSVDLLIPTESTDMYGPELDITEATHREHDTHRTNKRKKTKEVQDLSNTS